MRKLIERQQDTLIMCDNPNCDYTFPYSAESEKMLLAFVNMPCPKCGENLLTPEDYLASERLSKTVNRINKWFSWLTIFYSKSKDETIEVHVHNGINIKTK